MPLQPEIQEETRSGQPGAQSEAERVSATQSAVHPVPYAEAEERFLVLQRLQGHPRDPEYLQPRARQ